MPRRDPLETTLEQLFIARNDPRLPGSLALLRKVLAGRSSHAAARAAEIAGESEIEALAAFGSSRLREAFPVLKEWTDGVVSSALRRSGLLAIAMLKQDEAIGYLLDLVAGAVPLQAREAIKALAVYRHDDKLREQVGAAVNRRADGSLGAFFKEIFDSR